MQKGHQLQFDCLSCKEKVGFSIFALDKSQATVVCSNCSKQYVLKDPILQRQLRKFDALCRQIAESEEILGNTSVGVNIGEHHVSIPYKLLLTRFHASLDLKIGNQPLSIAFRLEPSSDVPEEIF